MKLKAITNRTFWVMLGWMVVAVPARAFYDPSLGRWLNRDPLQGVPSSILDDDVLLIIEKTDGPNLHGFVRNDPLNNFDDDGLMAHKRKRPSTYNKHTKAQGRPVGGAKPGNQKPNFTRGPKGCRCGAAGVVAAFCIALDEINNDLPAAGPTDDNGKCRCGIKKTACFLWWCWGWCEPDCT